MSAEARNRIARDYTAAFARDGSRTHIANLATTVGLHQWGEHTLPLTINDGGRGETFVCSPTVGYIDYPLEELNHFPSRTLVAPLRTLIRAVGGVLGRCGIDRIVNVNNWMLSTNLPVALDPTLAERQTRELVESHPDHFLAMRSLTRRHSAPLIAALEAAGWVLLPSRQVFLIDDVARQSMPHRDTRRDDALWRRGEFAYAELEAMSEGDARRIADLYALLYLDKYSRLNPVFTPAFIALTHAVGLIRYLVLRDAAGVIQAFGGMHHLGDHATMPLIGYDTAVDQDCGLYRLAFHAGTLYALRHGLRFNMSSGATAFKRNRGAVAEMEFTAFYARHLSAARRLPFGLLQTVANRVGIPLLRKYQL